MAKNKYVTSFLEKDHEKSSRTFIQMSVVDYSEKTGSRDRIVVIQKQRNPQERVVTKVRLVKYHNHDIKGLFISTTEGVEIVEEMLLPRGSEISEPEQVDGVERKITLNYDLVKRQKKALRKQVREEREAE